MSNKLILIAVTMIHLIFQIQCQDPPAEVCVSGAVDNFTILNGEYELQEGTHNDYPYYQKVACSTQYIYTYYWASKDIHFWIFYSNLTASYPESDPSLPECSAEGPEWETTPSDPTQCVGGWVVYTNATTNNYTLTNITVESGECASEIQCDTAASQHTNSDSISGGTGKNCLVNIKSGYQLKSSDIGSYSDPYVVLYGKYKRYPNLVYYLGRTTTKWNNENYPVWNEAFYVRYCKYDNLYFQVYDTDPMSSDDWMGDTYWRDVDLNTLPCGTTNYKRLYLNSDLDGDQGSLLVTVRVSC